MKFERSFWIPKDHKKFTREDVPNAECYISEEDLTAAGFSGKRSKFDFFNRFNNFESLLAHVNKYLDSVKRSNDYKKERREERKNSTNPYKVGDILYNSWGYEQTNVDFYQVVGLTKKCVDLKRIGSQIVEETGHDQGNAAPIKDSFLNDEKVIRKRVTSSEGRVSFEFGGGSKWDGKPVWSSWYY